MKTVDFSEIVARDLKVGRCRQLVAFMKVFEYSRSRSFLGQVTFAQGHFQMKIMKTCFSQKPLGHFLPNFVCTPSGLIPISAIFMAYLPVQTLTFAIISSHVSVCCLYTAD